MNVFKDFINVQYYETNVAPRQFSFVEWEK